VKRYRAYKHFVYILESIDGRYYCGYTNDVDKRIEAHKDGRGAKFTRAFGFKRLIYVELFRTKSRALKREAAIKKLERKEKEALWKHL